MLLMDIQILAICNNPPKTRSQLPQYQNRGNLLPTQPMLDYRPLRHLSLNMFPPKLKQLIKSQ